ncbi:MAG TPA: hypothetical protein VHC22_21320 [Pirellulales bacterium]|nr:hypothetical protein [Pirellulales bacterium]
MAREENEREDLLTEATALVERAELEMAGLAGPVVFGFRRDGAASVFFGSDPAYHFNACQELRRAFVAGLLFKTERAGLVSLTRRRVPGEVQMLRHELNERETGDFLAELVRRLEALRSALASGDFRLTGQVPASADVVDRLRVWLDGLTLPPPLAASPRAGK